MAEKAAFRRWLCMFILCLLAVGLSVYYIDRQLAEFFDKHIRHTGLWIWLNLLLAPLVLIPAASVFFLLGCGGWRLSGRPLAIWTVKPLLCSWSVMWALAAQLVFKAIFGRAWPDPTYRENHLYGFRFLHGSEHWSAFPSGTAAISAALTATIWLAAPALRLPALTLSILICAGVVVTNGRWVSDVIAGAFLGASIGWMTVLLSPATLPTQSNARI